MAANGECEFLSIADVPWLPTNNVSHESFNMITVKEEIQNSTEAYEKKTSQSSCQSACQMLIVMRERQLKQLMILERIQSLHSRVLISPMGDTLVQMTTNLTTYNYYKFNSIFHSYDEKLQTHYYYNDETKKTQWEHPLDNIYREIVKHARDASIQDDTCASVQVRSSYYLSLS